MLSVTQSFETVVSKFVPVTVRAVPGVPMVGMKPVIVGAVEVLTVKAVLLEARPVGVLTEIGPVAAPAGTFVTICVAIAETTVAVTPLNLTVFRLAVELKPVP